MKQCDKGFTLIEILIATSILVVVFMIGFVIFSIIMNSYYQAKAITRTSQAGRYVIETLSRGVRLANKFTADDTLHTLAVLPSEEGAKEATYGLAKDIVTGHQVLMVREEGQIDPNKLTDPQVVDVTEFTFGNGAQTQKYDFGNFDAANANSAANQQPFVTIRFTLRYVGEKSEKFPVEQTFQTTVTSQKYHEPETEL